MQSTRALNVACGSTFLESPQWINVDWGASSNFIQNVNVLKGLPYPDSSFDYIYTSHFIEHLQPDDLRRFFLDCFRLLKPGGVIRIVTPCFEEMVQEFINQFESDDINLATWMQVEILDQCVRNTPGGRVNQIREEAKKNSLLSNYIFSRTGLLPRVNISENTFKPKKQKLKEFLIKKSWGEKKYSLSKIFFTKYIKLVCRLLPTWFRKYHVSFTSPGEKHFWVFTYPELKAILESLGFYKLKKLQFDETGTNFRDFLELDCSPQLTVPRKGRQSMYVEAVKGNLS